MNSSILEPDTKFVFSHLGLKNHRPLREKNDGLTFFGSNAISTKENENPFALDFIIPVEKNKMDDRVIGRHFVIAYSIEFKHYFIKDLGKGLGTFLKMESKGFKIRHNSLFNIGDSYIVVTFEEENGGESLILKIFSGMNKHEPIRVSPGQKFVVIGRNIDCDIHVNDNMLSRNHCYLENKENQWILYDGCKTDEEIKASTNGTWVYLSDETELLDGMIIKTNHTVFRVNLDEY